MLQIKHPVDRQNKSENKIQQLLTVYLWTAVQHCKQLSDKNTRNGRHAELIVIQVFSSLIKNRIFPRKRSTKISRASGGQFFNQFISTTPFRSFLLIHTGLTTPVAQRRASSVAIVSVVEQIPLTRCDLSGTTAAAWRRAKLFLFSSQLNPDPPFKKATNWPRLDGWKKQQLRLKVFTREKTWNCLDPAERSRRIGLDPYLSAELS